MHIMNEEGIDMHIMNEAVRASLQSQLLSCFVTGSQLRPGSLLSSENQSLGYHQLIKIATPLVLQRKKLPREDFRDLIQPRVKIYKTTGKHI